MANEPMEENTANSKKRVRKSKSTEINNAQTATPDVTEASLSFDSELSKSGRPAKKKVEALIPTFQAAPATLAPARAAKKVQSESEEVAKAPEENRLSRSKKRRNKKERKGHSAPEKNEELNNEPAESENEVETEIESSDSHKRRRRRRARGEAAEVENNVDEDGVPTVVKVREPRPERPQNEERRERNRDRNRDRSRDRRNDRRDRNYGEREHRDFIRRRGTVLTETEFLARRDVVDRQMLVRQIGDRTQIAVLEDKILVEHYVNRNSNISYVGNVYLGKVQNVLPSMEAAFVDIGKGRNAVLYAGEVNWDLAGMAEDKEKKIENVLKTGDSVLVQVTKDPIGQKGARLTSQISLPGRFLVYVPSGEMSGISRRLTENERSRLKSILKNHLPDEEGVIIRTAAEGATAEEIEDDIKRLKAQWEDIETKSKNPATAAPTLLYSEPDLTVRVIRDIFNEEFNSLIVQGNDAWDDINNYLGYIAPELTNKLEKWSSKDDLFAVNRVDEQLAKAFDRKVYLPSGGSLVIDRTEAMVVVDVNTGKFIGKGGNLEETVTKNNLEAAEEIARQLRLRDLGGIIVIDFIDMTLESNRELVLRRLIECLGRDRTKHQVAEVTSLGLVQMTRKRVGQGLIEAFSTPCEHCNGRGIHIHTEPVKKVALDKDLDKPTFSSKDFEKRANRNSNSDEENDVEVEVDTFFDEAEADTANSQAESEELEKSPVAEQENSSAGNSPIGGNQRKAKKRRVVSSGGVVTPNLEA